MTGHSQTYRDCRRAPADNIREVGSDGSDATPQPAKATRVRLGPQAQVLFEAAMWAGNMVPNLDQKMLIKGWLGTSAVSLVFGPSNCGKTFLALDIAHHVAKGLQWAGRSVKKGRVLYVGAEGGLSIANRISALEDPEFWVIALPITLTGGNSRAGPLTEVMKHLGDVGGDPFDLIIIDTMSRVMGDKDENNAPDIADLIQNLDLIQRESGAHVMLIHHTGKDTLRGARGHSSLRAAVDTEIQLSRDDVGQITAEITKQRDGPTGGKYCYTLHQVELGEDQDGDSVTTCLVEPIGAGQTGSVDLPSYAKKALNILDDMIEKVSAPSETGEPGVAEEDWKRECTAVGGISCSKDEANRARTFRKAREKLRDARLVVVHNGRARVVEP